MISNHSFNYLKDVVKMNLTWRNPPAHHWYAAKSPGLSIQCRSSRADQTALPRFRRELIGRRKEYRQRLLCNSGSDCIEWAGQGFWTNRDYD
ncbi:hypothetical protein TNCV_2374981 [Trichonephila clavipes]|nr:hypothetical protein TNCV_2374981 [Trichonephila clavipes]